MLHARPTKQEISIVLVTYNSETIIKNFLLQNQLQDHKNIIIVDLITKRGLLIRIQEFIQKILLHIILYDLFIASWYCL